MDKILTSVKKMLGIQEADINFDQEIIMHINSVITVLTQLGVGPSTGFRIVGNTETWIEFLEDRDDLEIIKSYIYLKVRLLFDPPQNSFLVESLNKQIEEFEWRIQLQVEPYTLTAAKAAAEDAVEEE